MYKYKCLTNCGATLAFDSKHFIDDITPAVFPDATFLFFDDALMVINLTQTKDIEINGIKHQVKAYAV